MTTDENEFDILEFLADGPKIIQEFRDSPLFYVKEYDRGVYPLSLLRMLEEMEIIRRFRPYKSTKDEIRDFSHDLNGLTEERKQLLQQYVSWRLTALGRETLDTTGDELVEQTLDTEDNVLHEFEHTSPLEEPEEPVPHDGQKTEALHEIPETVTNHAETPISKKKHVYLNASKSIDVSDAFDIKSDTLDTLEKKEDAEIPAKTVVKTHSTQDIDQNINEMKIIEERDEHEILTEEIANKKTRLQTLQEEYENLGRFNRSRKKELESLIDTLKSELEKMNTRASSF